MNIHKTANISEDDIPDINTIIAYIQSLRLYESENSLKPEYSKLIANLPHDRSLKRDYSVAEVNIIFGTVNFLWEKITGNDIINQQDHQEAPKKFVGNYWILKSGIILGGVNHFTIVKENIALVETLLGLNGFTLQHYLASEPNPLIAYILRSNAIRMFVDVNGNAFFQMTDKVYGEWGKKKVKKLDFRSSTVKVVDTKVDFKGWDSGIPIKL